MLQFDFKNDDDKLKSHKLVSFLIVKFILRFLKRDSFLQILIYQVVSSLSTLLDIFWGKFNIQGYKMNIAFFLEKNDIALNPLPWITNQY